MKVTSLDSLPFLSQTSSHDDFLHVPSSLGLHATSVDATAATGYRTCLVRTFWQEKFTNCAESDNQLVKRQRKTSGDKSPLPLAG